MPLPDCLTVRSPSKINVYLEVLGRRADGFHQLETIMLRTQLSDVMRFEVTNSADVTLQLAEGTPPAVATQIPLDGSNLILRAAASLSELTGTRRGVRITLAKRIPPESGLAGGSGNAATTLSALNRLWDLKLPAADLHSAAASLGSDINFLLSGCRAAICRGRGEQVQPLPIRGRFYFVAIRPRRGNSTGEVFRRLAKLSMVDNNGGSSGEEKASCVPKYSPDPRFETVVKNLRGGKVPLFAIGLFNRLTTPATFLNSELACLLETVQKSTYSRLHMSGSGSMCVIPVTSRRAAGVLATRLRSVTGLPTRILWT